MIIYQYRLLADDNKDNLETRINELAKDGWMVQLANCYQSGDHPAMVVTMMKPVTDENT